jgi:glycosyltransferase involved in cell wall biosynthesis
MLLCRSPGFGGLELYALREIEVLRGGGTGCFPVVASDTMLASRLEEKSIPARIVARSVTVLPLITARRVARLIDAQAIDVLHIHWAKDLPLAALAKKLARRSIKLIYSRHMALTRSKLDWWHRWQYRQVDQFVVVTRLLARQATELLPLDKSRIRVLYLGVKKFAESGADCKRFFGKADFPRRKLNLALFGRIEPYKGQHVLIEAVEALKARGLDISATLIGHVMDRDYATRLQQEVGKKNLNRHIRFIDFVPEAARHMGCFDVIVLATEAETFGLVLVEAMQAGVAVIGTNAGGVPEIIEDGITGLLTEPGNSVSLARVIERLYHDEALRQELAAQGRKKALGQFSEAVHFERLMEIFNEK